MGLFENLKIIFLCLIVTLYLGNLFSQSRANNFLSTFNSLEGNSPQAFTLLKQDTFLNLPVGHDDLFYHQQGIQKLSNGGFAVSGSAQENGYIYLTDSSLNVVTVITPEFRNQENEKYNHLGGFQVSGNILAIGLERLESRAKGTSLILFYDVADIENPIFLEHLSIVRNASGKQTAGAVGLVNLNDHWIVMVANWDAARIDMYRSSQLDLRNPYTRFDQQPALSWESATGFAENSIDQTWGNYQNIHLFNPKGEEIWMIGTHSKRVGLQQQNWADLYRINISDDTLRFTKKSKKQFLAEDVLFKDGAGFFYDKALGMFEVFACERNMSEEGLSRCSRWASE